MANIPVSPTNPTLTAAAIQQAFLSTTQYNVLMAPVEGEDEAPFDGGPNTMNWSVQVVVTPAPTAADPQGLLTFDVTFVGNLGYEDLPQLVIPAGKVIDANKTPVNATDLTAVIQKESSPEFRVNPEVPVSPFQLQPDQSIDPAVAMDADGDFVISWTSYVSNLANNGSVSDIFARYFDPVGDIQPVQDIVFTPVEGASFSGNFTLTTDKGTNRRHYYRQLETLTRQPARCGRNSSRWVTTRQWTSVSRSPMATAAASAYALEVTWGRSDFSNSMGLMQLTNVSPSLADVNPEVTSPLYTVDTNNDGVRDTLIQGVRPAETPSPTTRSCPRTFRCPATCTPSV